MTPVLLATLLALAAAPRPTAAPPQRPEPRPVTLGELTADPAAHLGQRVTFVMQLDLPLDAWNPYLTRFGTRSHAAWRVWADEQHLWNEADFRAPAGTVFARRGSPAEAGLAGARRFERFRVQGVVAQVFLGRPWIELDGVARLAEQVTEGSILHAGRAVQLMAGGEWKLAQDDLARALAPRLPAGAREELERLHRACAAQLAR